MSSAAVTYTFRPAAREADEDRPCDDPTPAAKSAPNARPVPRLAHTIALAHFVEHAVASGLIASHAEAARRLGITSARMSQVMLLLSLSPTIIERVLTGEIRISERRIRPVAMVPDWSRQAEELERIGSY